MNQKPPRPHWDPPGWQKIFWVARIWKPYGRKKNFWIISHRKKVGLTIPSAWRPFWILGCATLVAKLFSWGHVLNQRGRCPWPFKTKKRLHWGGDAPGVFWGASLLLDFFIFVRISVCLYVQVGVSVCHPFYKSKATEPFDSEHKSKNVFLSTLRPASVV